jgi:hypothetical protein
LLTHTSPFSPNPNIDHSTVISLKTTIFHISSHLW